MKRSMIGCAILAGVVACGQDGTSNDVQGKAELSQLERADACIIAASAVPQTGLDCLTAVNDQSIPHVAEYYSQYWGSSDPEGDLDNVQGRVDSFRDAGLDWCDQIGSVQHLSDEDVTLCQAQHELSLALMVSKFVFSEDPGAALSSIRDHLPVCSANYEADLEAAAELEADPKSDPVVVTSLTGGAAGDLTECTVESLSFGMLGREDEQVLEFEGSQSEWVSSPIRNAGHTARSVCNVVQPGVGIVDGLDTCDWMFTARLFDEAMLFGVVAPEVDLD